MEHEVGVESVASRSTREMGKRRFRRRLALAFVGFGGLLIIGFAGLSVRSVSGLLGCMFAIVIIDRAICPAMDWLKLREGHAIRGAEAEESIGAILARLPPSCLVLHDINGRYGNIDHVVFRED